VDNSQNVETVILPARRELKIYKFKAPAFLRKLTNTYFKRSQIEDLKMLKKRIIIEKKKYRSR